LISDRIVNELLDAIGAPSFAGRIELGAEVGRGGMGVVYRATEVGGGRTLAVKLLRRADRRDVERFSREAAILEDLDHPNIVGCVEHGVTANGEAYLVMEWVDGSSLSAALRSGPLEIAEAVAIARGLAAALAAAHERGVIHRDLKPSNVILAGAERRPVLLDFGVARRIDVDDKTLTETGEVVGTPGYLSPEQIEGGEIDGRADLFALGCVLYQMLTGARAFPGTEIIPVMVAALTAEPEDLASMRPEVPERLAGLIGALLAKDPGDRPASATEVEAELAVIAAAIERGDEAALATTRFERPVPRSRRLGWRLGVALVADAVVAAAIVAGLVIAAGAMLFESVGESAGPCDRDRQDGCAVRCGLGDAEACARFGQKLAFAVGPERDREAALPLLVRACTRGVGRACFTAATLTRLAGGDWRPRFVELSRRGCELGFGNACRRLGNHHVEGDRPAALRWYRAGCEAGDPMSCRRACELGDEAACAGAPRP
jgi:predicted Ser/Thr protein kinase